MKFKSQKSKVKIASQNSKVFRIIDVNANRAVEGLRVMEEIVRFVLEDKKLTRELKKMRSRIRGITGGFALKERKALKDVGGGLYTQSEGRRSTFLDIFAANAKRVQEALRALEEFSKLIKPRLGKSFKKLRFKVYDLEKHAFYRLTRRLKLDFDLYVITDPMRDHVKTARAVIAGGARIVQLRDKSASKKQILKWAKKIRKIAKGTGAIFIVNDYPEIAEAVDADGVHLGQGDLSKMPIKRIRARLGEESIIGVTVRNPAQAVWAENQGADYISLGPVFATPFKPGIKPRGLNLLKKVISRTRIPVVAIGGINRANVRKVLRTGCSRVAAIRAILEKRDIRRAVRSFRSILRKGPDL